MKRKALPAVRTLKRIGRAQPKTTITTIYAQQRGINVFMDNISSPRKVIPAVPGRARLRQVSLLVLFTWREMNAMLSISIRILD